MITWLYAINNIQTFQFSMEFYQWSHKPSKFSSFQIRLSVDRLNAVIWTKNFDVNFDVSWVFSTHSELLIYMLRCWWHWDDTSLNPKEPNLIHERRIQRGKGFEAPVGSGTNPGVYMVLIRSLIGTQGPSGGGWIGEAGSGYCILLGGS